jgi:hypothetical protein
MLSRTANLINSLWHWEQRCFVRVLKHHDNDLLKQPTAALDQIKMTARNRIKTAGIKGYHKGFV